MTEMGITEPRCYWKSQYDSGSLLMKASQLQSTKVMFPVGLPREYYAENGKGYVTRATTEEDKRVWKVQILGGIIDTMSEWPLLCGIDQFQRYEMENSRQTQKAEEDKLKRVGDAAKVTYYGIKGTPNDGVVCSLSELAKRLVGEKPEFAPFDSREEAEAWVSPQTRWCAVRLQTGQGVALLEQQAKDLLGSQHGLIMCGPTDENSARTIADHWTKQARRNKLESKKTAAAPSQQQKQREDSKPAPVGRSQKQKEPPKETMQQDNQEKLTKARQQLVKLCSPEEGIKYPDSKLVFAKEKAGSKTIFAVRTFPDSFEVQQAGHLCPWMHCPRRECVVPPTP